VPSTTQESGRLAMHTGSPVSSGFDLSRFFSNCAASREHDAQSLMSAESSGGVRSRAMRIALTIVDTHSLNASRILAVIHGNRLGPTLDETPPFDLHGQRHV